MGTGPRYRFAWSVGALLSLTAQHVVAQQSLLGLPTPQRVVVEPAKVIEHDDEWPWGHDFFSSLMRPLTPAIRMCSFLRPLCVHGRNSALVFEILAEAEVAFDTLRRRMGLPSPAADDGAGGSSAFDLYLTEGRAAAYELGFEPARTSPYDRAATFGYLDAALPGGCERRTAIHRLLALASLATIDAGETGGFSASSANYLATQTTGCLGPILAAVDDAQQAPQRAQIPVTASDAEASPLFPWYLDSAFGAGPPGTFLAALWHLGTQTTPPEATRFHNHPDLFTTLSALARGRQKLLPDVLIDAAIARAFLGDRDDGRHLPESRWLGALGRVRFDASYGYSTLPRRLSFTPLEPTGAVYVWVDLRGVPPGARMGLQASWEEPVTLRWAAVRVDPAGREHSRIDVTWEPHVHHVERQLLELDNLAGLLVVGVNVGEIGPGHPFRPDEAPYEPHGGTLLLVADVPSPLQQPAGT